MISVADRRHLVKLIDWARKQGARLHPACETVGISAKTYQRWTEQGGVAADGRPDAQRPVPSNKLSSEERKQIITTCNKSEFASLPPGQIVPMLADQGQYIGSESSFYRVLKEFGMQQHRGRSRKAVRTPPPKGYCAARPNQVWSWDVTWLSTPIRGMFYYLYMIVDVYSRKITGWEVQPVETGALAAELVQRAVLAERCQLNPPVLHADNGGPQRGCTLRARMDALGITPSFSRPRVSNDNPYSEALFRTLKYRPAFPEHGFASLDTAREWVAMFVQWYNESHLHSRLRYVTPADRHQLQDNQKLEARKQVYLQARKHHPERWTGPTRNWQPIGPVWLNKPGEKSEAEDYLQSSLA
jgi:transposase InsO family protein